MTFLASARERDAPTIGVVDIGLMSASMLDRPWEEVLDAAVAQEVGWVEACGGGHIPTRHFDPVELARDSAALGRFKATLEQRGLRVGSLACHGNPLHPDEARAAADDAALVGMCAIAPELGVTHVNLLAGLPPGGPDDATPNWIVNSVFPGLDDVYRWQWEERVIPYWRRAARVAADAGVVLCVEPHPSDVVYNAPTFLRLREAVGPQIGMNFDPSHLWWQGIDPLAMLEELAPHIRTVHVKDLQTHPARVAAEGVLDRCPMSAGTSGRGPSARRGMATPRSGGAGWCWHCAVPALTACSASSARTPSLPRTTPSAAPWRCYDECCRPSRRRPSTGLPRRRLPTSRMRRSPDGRASASVRTVNVPMRNIDATALTDGVIP